MNRLTDFQLAELVAGDATGPQFQFVLGLPRRQVEQMWEDKLASRRRHPSYRSEQ